ncbi:homocysteine S-methyltransferase [Microbacterium trichothecenolyticum]|uniref:homocysteine S-methyltransferase n=1 Tax=Microbacterium trichothecenolyticum TaxID=69370 RepID=UPI001C6EE841|nr:homocysteine S-methyltransferase [Microbacterium trichothecenolyticum]MBW9119619.1 homocysteine S-methyltransferase [Microbacterium trichothecenolyticum]
MIASTSPVVVLDGGLSNALAERGHDLTDELWTARLLRDAPGEVAAVHRAYFDAGAQVATTASYQASVAGFERTGLTRAEAEGLITMSVTIAREVRDEVAESAGGDVVRLVAASVGPYGAVLADGSEYRGRYGLSRAALRDFHAPRMELLASARPDLLALETIPDLDEVAVLLDLADEFAIPAWLSCTVSGDRLRDGTPTAEAFALAAGHDSIVAVGVNCCTPDDVLPAVRSATAASGKPGIAYPNSGETWDGAARRWVGDPEFDLAPTTAWVDAGARFIGGCCRVGPAAIAAIARALG